MQNITKIGQDVWTNDYRVALYSVIIRLDVIIVKQVDKETNTRTNFRTLDLKMIAIDFLKLKILATTGSFIQLKRDHAVIKFKKHSSRFNVVWVVVISLFRLYRRNR